jgi:signal transduction histidine kinase
LLAINFWYEYQEKKREIEEKIHIEMKLCAYTIECEGLETDFVDKEKDKEENMLYKDGDFYSYFQVPTVNKYLMKVTYPRKKYTQRVEKVGRSVAYKFMLYSWFAALVSLLFAMYALRPLRRALHLNEEFVKDILHDFNTPIASMKVNLSLFKREIGENLKIQRLENNIESILSLQNNLQVFLKDIPTQTDTFALAVLIDERMGYFMTLYPDVNYMSNVSDETVTCNRDAFTRILDNILSNAGKYNKAQGNVHIDLNEKILSVSDTGKGIKDPKKIFRRYYKEQDRGIGIGLHIVKKLCMEMGIEIEVKSEIKKGTTILLDISSILT